MTRPIAILIAAGLTLASVASAGENDVYTFGSGVVTSCGTWSQQGNDERAATLQWVLGFVSGSNWHSGSSAQARAPDVNAIVAFVDLYCRNNPLHGIALAAAAVVQEMGGPKALHQWRR